jgi:hypothetical protein
MDRTIWYGRHVLQGKGKKLPDALTVILHCWIQLNSHYGNVPAWLFGRDAATWFNLFVDIRGPTVTVALEGDRG